MTLPTLYAALSFVHAFQDILWLLSNGLFVLELVAFLLAFGLLAFEFI